MKANNSNNNNNNNKNQVNLEFTSEYLKSFHYAAV